MDVCCKRFVYSLGNAVLLAGLAIPSVRAQSIIPNGLGSQVSDGACISSCVITGGRRPVPTSQNLFHSFSQFSIPEGATATLLHDADIANIFLRVTDAPSLLDGQLATDVGGAAGQADLFFLNPQGIIFGSNASLDLGGSFIGTTAEQVHFGSEAEAFRVNDAQPILSVNIPVGLQLGATSGPIDVGTEQAPGPGNGLFINGRDFSINRGNRPDGLAVPEGKTLALVGNGLELIGTNLTAARGNIELGSLQANESISLAETTSGWQFSYAVQSQFSQIDLSKASSLDASGTNGGYINVRGGQINLSEGSIFLAETLGSGTGGGVNVDATTLDLTGISSVSLEGLPPAFLPISTGIFADLALGQSGTGGDVNVTSKAINLKEGALISSSTFGSGTGGNLALTTDSLSLSGGTPFSSSAVLAGVGLGASGDGGRILIQAKHTNLRDGAGIIANTFGEGNAGAIKLHAEQIDIAGINIGSGPSGIQSGAAPSAQGRGGDIEISTSTLKIADGAQITSSTFSSSAAGRLEINAATFIEVVGRSDVVPPSGRETSRSGLLSSAVLGSGRAGDIKIHTPILTVKDGGIISVSNFPSFAGLPPGTGPSGNITITADQITLDGDAGLGAKTNHNVDGPGGANIEISAGRILLNNKSFINASAEGTADGGNVILTTPFLVAVPKSDSNITANARAGDGGNIAITAKGILGLAIQPAITNNGTNDIDASSEVGADGVISTQGLDADSNVDLVNIPDAPRDASQLIGNACNGPSKTGGQFLITGRGGLPPKPKAMRAGLTPLIEFDDDLLAQLATDTTAAGATIQPSQSPLPRRLSRRPSPNKHSLAEAQHWKRGPNNQITLIASHGATPSQRLSTTCL